MNFDQAFDRLIRHEGGFVDHPADPGGATKWGVTQRVARDHGYTGDMRELPIDEAKRIARAAYWDAVRADSLPPRVRYVVFDGAYHSGVRQSARWLQRALGVAEDGIIGPVTIAAARAADEHALMNRVLAQRLRFLTALGNWPSFSRGWARRIADLMET